MNIRSTYDSEFCGSLPLHLINLIQPYGYIFVLKKEDLSIIQVSENVAELWDIPAKSFINTFFSDHLAEQDAAVIDNFKLSIGDKIPLPLSLSINGITLQLLALPQPKGDLIIVELELLNDEVKNSFISVYQNLRHTVHAIEKQNSVREVCEVSIRELKKISGFDRVMMYQFDEQWNGTVIAEDNNEELYESYLGLKFPASDIPKQARELYLKNAYRLIPNRDYSPVGFYPVVNSVTQTFLDLTDCNLRGVPKVHLEYLRNMKVKASMSIRVIKDEKLWGLISCHSHSEKYLNYEICSIFQLLSNIISNKITAILNKEDYAYKNQLNGERTQLIDLIYTKDDLFKALLKSEVTLLDLLKCPGAVLIYNRRTETIGKVPDKEFIENLSFWLQARNIKGSYQEISLADSYEQALGFQDTASGILVIPINQDKGEYIIGFRPEVVHTVTWGGNPNEAINFEADNKTYHPRNSFKQWSETVKQTCQPWQASELAVYENFRSFLYEYTTR